MDSTATRCRTSLRGPCARAMIHLSPVLPTRWLHTVVLLLCLAQLPGALPEARADVSSRGEAIQQALSQNGGRGKVLGVREEQNAEGKVYAVKVLTDGRVRVFRIRGR